MGLLPLTLQEIETTFKKRIEIERKNTPTNGRCTRVSLEKSEFKIQTKSQMDYPQIQGNVASEDAFFHSNDGTHKGAWAANLVEHSFRIPPSRFEGS